LKPTEYRERASAIERRANEELERLRNSFRVHFPAHRSTRYASGMADVIREMAISSSRNEIERRMRVELDALDAEMAAFYHDNPEIDDDEAD
jgi:hypothetical protein